MRKLVSLVALIALMMLMRLPAAAVDDVSIGMVRLPTAVFIAFASGILRRRGLHAVVR
jgi:hypothetical protein